MISSILAFRGGTLNRDIMDFFGLDPSIGTSSAFIQQRAKILPEAFEFLFQYFVQKTDESKLYHGLRMLAVDGSSLQIASNPHDLDSYFPGANGQKAYNLLHINAMYDLLQHTYTDAVIQKSRKGILSSRKLLIKNEISVSIGIIMLAVCNTPEIAGGYAFLNYLCRSFFWKRLY